MKIRLFIFVFIPFISFSQITVTDADVVGIGDQIVQAIDDNVSMSVPSSGPNQTWVLPQLSPNSWETRTFMNPANTPYASSYPNANLVAKDDINFTYVEKSSTGVRMLGVDDTALLAPLLLIPLPLVYGGTHVDGPHIVLDSVIGGPVVDFLVTDTDAFFLSGLVFATSSTTYCITLSLIGIFLSNC